MSKKGISLVGIHNAKEVARIREQYPGCYFELSYLSTEQSLSEELPLIEGRVASIHLLAPKREFFPNLASEKSYAWSEREILLDAELALKLGAENLVLHPGYLVDGLVYSNYSQRLPQIKALNLDEYLIYPQENVCAPSYIHSPQYLESYKIMKENALILSEKVRAMGLNLCLENLNPRGGYMILHPDECIDLANAGLSLCLDVGHLHVNSFVFGFDTLTEIKRILDTGAVKTMHLHSNESQMGLYKDSHKSFNKYMPYWKEIVTYGQEKGANLILEVLEECEQNVGLLFS